MRSHRQRRRRTVAADAQFPHGWADHLQERAARPGPVLEQDVALKPDAGQVIEAVEAAGHALAFRAVGHRPGDAGSDKVADKGEDEQPAAQPPQPFPVEHLPQRQLIDPVGGLVDGFLDHRLRETELGRLVGVGQLDRGDQPITQLLREAPLQQQGQGGVGELLEQPVQDHRDHQAQQDQGQQAQHAAPEPGRQEIDPIEPHQPEGAVIDQVADPEAARQEEQRQGQAFQADVAADVAAQPIQGVADSAVVLGQVTRALGGHCGHLCDSTRG